MNELLTHLDDLKQRHLGAIMNLIDETIERESPPESSLVGMSRYHLSTGGKRLRALLPLAVAEALGRSPGDVIAFAAACEVLHNATLVHDDLQDGDTSRRGEPTVWVEFGRAQAINLGDALLYYTILLARQVPHGPEARERLITRVVRETIRVIDGQEREFSLQTGDLPTEADYVRMVEGKTSGLFALPMAGTAELLDADEDVVRGLARAAGHLGVLFQIQDDVLDLYGEKGRGKPGSDIGEGKMSILVVHCLNRASTPDVEWLQDVLARDRDEVSDEDVARAIALFRDCGALRHALEEIERRRVAALDVDEIRAHPRLARLVAGIAELFVAPIAQLTDAVASASDP